MWAKTAGKCLYCHCQLDFLFGNEMVLDHYVPLSKGGIDDHSNLVPACKFCDSEKRNCMPTPDLFKSLYALKHGLLAVKKPIDFADGINKKKRRKKRKFHPFPGMPNPVIPVSFDPFLGRYASSTD